MKIAEALIIRSDLQKKIEQIKTRLIANAKVQEGDKTAENPEKILAEFEQVSKELAEIITKINLTNSQIKDEKGETLTKLLAEKDVLTMKISALRVFLETARAKTDRYSNKEIRIISSVDIQKKQNALDLLSKDLRELDIKIQALNWSNDLI